MEREQEVNFLRDMLRARRFEERAAEEYAAGHIAGFLHLYPGEEAVAVGVLHAGEPGDYVVSTYREHVHALVRGVPARAIMAELFGRKTGISKGMGGSMHLFDTERRFMGGYAIVGETYPVAIGIAYAVLLRELPEAVICFFGDGAVNQGTFHESLNMAALWRLPVLFVCENNHYQIGTEIHRHSAVTDVYKRACAYNIPAQKIDGMDVHQVFAASGAALRRVRAGEGPQLIEFETYRFRGHSMADPGAYRPQAELRAYQANDPLAAEIRQVTMRYPSAAEIAGAGPDTLGGLAQRYLDEGHLSDEQLDELKREVEAEIEDAVTFAAGSAEPSWDDAWGIFHRPRHGEVLT